MEVLSFLNQGLSERVWDFEKALELKGKNLQFISSQGGEIICSKILKVEVESRSTFRRATFSLDGDFKFKGFELVAVSCNEPQIVFGDDIFEGEVEILD